MKPLLIFAFLVGFSVAYSQTNIQKKNVRTYNSFVNKAELFVCDKQYKKASDCYAEAFKSHDPFAQDAYFAFRVNYEQVRDTLRILECIQHLIQLGDRPDWIIEDSTKDPYFYRCAQELFETTKIEVVPSLNQEFLEILESDQRVMTQYFESDEEFFNAIDSVMRLNLKRLKRMYRKYSVVNDYTVGRSVTGLYVPLIHLCKYLNYDAKKILSKEVRKGNYNVQKYIILKDYCLNFSPKYNSNETTIYGTNLNWGINDIYFILQPKNLPKVNRRRRRLLTDETWQDYEKKVEYIVTKRVDYFFYAPMTWIDKSSDEMENSLRQSIDDGSVRGTYLHITP